MRIMKNEEKKKKGKDQNKEWKNNSQIFYSYQITLKVC